jgi:hypothetical protein
MQAEQGDLETMDALSHNLAHKLVDDSSLKVIDTKYT